MIASRMLATGDGSAFISCTVEGREGVCGTMGKSFFRRAFYVEEGRSFDEMSEGKGTHGGRIEKGAGE